MSTIHDRLREIRERSGLSVRGFAQALQERCGYRVSHGSVSGYENGRTVPAEYAAAVTRAFALNPQWLLLGEGSAIAIPPSAESEAFQEIASVVDRFRPAPSGVETDLQLFFELSPLLFAIEADGHLIRVNGAWGEVLGYQEDELVREPVRSFVHPDDPCCTDELRARSVEAEGETLSRRSRFRHADGGYRWLAWNCRAVGERIYAVAADVTNEVEAEESLEETVESLGQVVDQCPHGIVIQREGEVLFSNPAARSLLAGDPTGTLEEDAWSRLLPPELRSRPGAVPPPIPSEVPFRPVAIPIPSPEGGELTVDVAAVPVLFGGEEAVQIVIRPPGAPGPQAGP